MRLPCRFEGVDGAFIFSDGSLLETGNVGGGAFVAGTDGVEWEVEVEIGSAGVQSPFSYLEGCRCFGLSTSSCCNMAPHPNRLESTESTIVLPSL